MDLTLSVSLLNVVVNVAVLGIVVFGGDIIRAAMYRATQLQLKKHGKAPLLTEGDQWQIELRNRLYWARKTGSPLLLFLSSFGVVLIVTEVFSEFGVSSSTRCSPKRFQTEGICAGKIYMHDQSSAQPSVTAYHAKSVPWNDKQLVSNPIYEGLRFNFDGQECFDKKPTNKNQRVIIANCSVSKPIFLQSKAASLVIKVIQADKYYVFLSSVDVSSSNGSKRTYPGKGDLAHHWKDVFPFLASPESSSEGLLKVRMFEYYDSRDVFKKLMPHFKSIAEGATTVRFDNASPLMMYTISCGTVADHENFARALQAYRTVQLEDWDTHLTNLTISGVDSPVVLPMTASDVVRAGIALASTHPEKCLGETYVYGECGIYNVVYILPLLLTVSFLLIFLFIAAQLVRYRKAEVDLPYTSTEWSTMALENTVGLGFGGLGRNDGSVLSDNVVDHKSICVQNGFYEVDKGNVANGFRLSCMVPKWLFRSRDSA